MRKYTPDNIEKLEPNQIFVFGSNAKGIHGKGAALIAKQKFGAIYGQASGLQGKSYAIITKKDWRVNKSSTLDEIKHEICHFIIFAKRNPQLEFLVTKIGTSLAGYTIEEIKNIFVEYANKPSWGIPDNIILPIEFECRN
jgi:hypothetical protein